MQKRLLYILILFCFAATQTARADYMTSMRQDIVPPSPTSSCFAKYMAQQPNMVSGAVRIDIPIYTIKAFGFEIPISISYFSNGIKVNDDPYPCGYGWTLLPGLRITRTVMGRPDEEVPSNRFYYEPTENCGYEFFRNCVSDDLSFRDSKIDTEHDIFSLNLPNTSCTFLLVNESNGYRAIHNADDMLRFDLSSFPSSITVTDGQGTQYLFSGETSYCEQPNWRSCPITAWALKEITLDNGEKFSFLWEKHGHNATTNAILNAYTVKDMFNRSSVVDHKHDSESADGSSDYVLTLPDGTNISGNYSGYLHLKKITFPGGTVDFSYMNQNDPYLLNILVKNSSGTHVKTADMCYSTDTSQGKLLNSISISGDGIFRFDYNPQRFEVYEAQDYWGFYNGATSNMVQGSLTPLMKFRTINGKSYESWVTVGAADRHVDTLKMQANIITRVTYPTGGYTSFEYEPHHLNWTNSGQYSTNIDSQYRTSLEYGGGLRLKKTITSEGGISGSSPDVIREYRYDGFGSDKANCIAFPELETFIDGYTCCEYAYSESGLFGNIYGCQYRMLFFNSASSYLDCHIGETPIWYDKVTEICADGKTEFANSKLVNPTWEYDTMIEHTLRFHSNLDAVFSKGIVNTSRKVFKSTSSGYVPVIEQVFNYSLSNIDADSNTLPSMQVKRNIWCFGGQYAPDVEFDNNGYVTEIHIGSLMPSPPYLINTTSYGQVYEYGFYSVSLQTERLYSENSKEYVYSNGLLIDSITSVTTKAYCANSPMIKQTTASLSDGTSLTTIYDYPFETAIGEPSSHINILQSMCNRNVVATPYKVTATKGTAVTINGRIFSQVGNGMYRPIKDYLVKHDDTITVHNFNYDVKGNIRGITYFGGQSETYIWGYGGLYPIFAIAGVSANKVDRLLTNDILPPITCSSPSNYFSDICQKLNNAGILTMYEYKPLIGISGISDMNGVRTQYDYDTQNRLSDITIDGYGKTKSYYYHLNENGTNKIIARTYRNANAQEYVDSVTYFDGLGRPIQTISGIANSSSTTSTLANYTTYDAMGRACKQWLPIPYSGSGEYVSFDDFLQSGVDIYSDNYPYQLTEYERSPLKRIERVINAGEAWHNAGKGVTNAILTNSAEIEEYKCNHYTIEGDGSIKLRGLYAHGTLKVTQTTDEDGQKTITFKDLQDQTVLTRKVVNPTTFADTYFVIDDYNELRFVLPPIASAEMTSIGQSWTKESEPIAKYGYCYDYDVVGNITRKQLPGNVITNIRYDRANKPVLTQDGNQHSSGKWMLHLFDRFGRKVLTALSDDSIPASRIDSIADSDLIVLKARRSNTIQQYSLSTSLDTISEVPEAPEIEYVVVEDELINGNLLVDRSKGCTVSLPCQFTPVEMVYYDDYAFLDSLSTEERQKYLPQDINGVDEIEPLIIGQPTGGKRALSNGSEKMLLYVNYYDRLGRVVQICEDNILGKVDYNGTTYSFTGMPVTAEKLYNHSSSNVSHLVYTNTYDALDRNLSTTLSINESAAQLLQTNTYDSLGRLQNAAMGNNAASVSYGYNLRGWATGITSNQFSQQIYYQDTTGGSTPCFNGNISSMAWMQSGATGNSSKSGRYNYTYDMLDRLTAAAFADNDNRSFSSQYQYDLHGNVTNIQRSGVAERITDGAAETLSYGVIDNVTLSYSGNRLQVADDEADALVYDGAMDFTDGANEEEEYAYDANGNMTTDLNRGIESITYDWNNMPREITFTSGAITRYTYDAAGRKLRAEYITPLTASANYALGPTPPIVPPLTLYDLSTVDYHGDCVLRNDSLERVLTPNGYIASDTLHYYIKDYQGNVRCVVRHDGTLVESSEYYPYGGLFAATASAQPYKYGAKELDRTHGLDLYDSEARWYDSLIGRTSTMDPLAEKYYSLSPYLWCAGNPVRFVDPNGNYVIGNDNQRVTFNKETGKLSDNLSNTHFVIFNAMLKTEIGSQRLNDMLEAEYLIGVRLESTSFGEKCGETKTFTTIDSETGEKTIAFVNIVLFNEEISEMLGRETLYKGNGFTLEDAIGAIATHEARHATDKSANEIFEPSKYKREELAGSDEKEYINERIKER